MEASAELGVVAVGDGHGSDDALAFVHAAVRALAEDPTAGASAGAR